MDRIAFTCIGFPSHGADFLRVGFLSHVIDIPGRFTGGEWSPVYLDRLGFVRGLFLRYESGPLCLLTRCEWSLALLRAFGWAGFRFRCVGLVAK